MGDGTHFGLYVGEVTGGNFVVSSIIGEDCAELRGQTQPPFVIIANNKTPIAILMLLTI